MTSLLDVVAERFAKELTPKERRGSPPPNAAELEQPDSTHSTGRKEVPPPPPPPEPELSPGELPDPDP